ncbi:hypothetical protein WAI453_008498 [Rhynchosporium graminicola]
MTTQQNFISEGSPSPLPSNSQYPQRPADGQQPRRRNQTVSVGWVEGDDINHRSSRLQIELAECVETKTVTTTTTTKRSYPPLLVQQQPLEQLNAKEYPLAMKPPPAELMKFSYEIEGGLAVDEHDEIQEDPEMPSCSHINSMNELQEYPHGRPFTKSPVHQEEHQCATQCAKTLGQELSSALAKRNTSRLRENSPSSPSHIGRRKPYKHTTQKPESQEPRPSIAGRRRYHGLGVQLSQGVAFPATPDMSEHDVSIDRSQSSFFESAFTPQSGLSQIDSFDDVHQNPAEALEDGPFESTVATPPVAESDLELSVEASSTNAHGSAQRPTLNTAAAQNASLPSPGLSPTFASAELHQTQFPGSHTSEAGELAASSDTQSGDCVEADETEISDLSNAQALSLFRSEAGELSQLEDIRTTSIMDAQSMLHTFDAMPSDMQTLMMYQLLRRCSRKTLHVIANVVNPALKCDFLDQLPMELSLHILGFLNHRDLCRAAQVSKRWRDLIDTNETGWKELFDLDGFVIPVGELDKAIHQGWGWQDPVGPDGFEQDLSVDSSPAGELSIATFSKTEAPCLPRKGRSATKRKRTTGGSALDRSKRRAIAHEFADKAEGMLSKYPFSVKFHKSEGPISAASAAALAVPDPELSLPGIRKLHLFKSLYRRHYMLHNSWMDGKVAPHHFAFPAHPAHVITCLQFDDDKILTGSDDTLIHVYDTKTGVLRKKLAGHEGGVWALQYEGNVLVSGSTDRSVRVWDIEKGLCTQVFHGHTSTVRCLQILMPEMIGKASNGKLLMVPEKPLIITGSRDSQLRVWRLPEQGAKRFIQNGPPANDADCPYFVRTLTGHLHSVRAIAARQDTLVSGSYDHTVRVWKISTGETVHRLQGHTTKVYSVVLDHKRNRCISGSMDTFVKIWSLDTGACLFTLEGHSSLVGLLDLRDELLVSAAADSTLRIWDPETGNCKSSLSAHTGAITCFQHDGQKVISGSDRTLKLWNIKSGEVVKDLLTDLSGVWQVKFDERRCVAAVQRDNLTYVEVLDFGASRDGIPASQRGARRLLPNSEDLSSVGEDDARF